MDSADSTTGRHYINVQQKQSNATTATKKGTLQEYAVATPKTQKEKEYTTLKKYTTKKKKANQKYTNN